MIKNSEVQLHSFADFPDEHYALHLQSALTAMRIVAKRFEIFDPFRHKSNNMGRLAVVVYPQEKVA